MPLDKTRETPALALANHVHFVGGLELVHQYAITLFQIVVAGAHADLAQILHTVGAGLLQVRRHRLGRARGLGKFHKSKLHGVVAIGNRRLALNHNTRSRLEQRNRHNLSIRAEHLRHPDFLA